MQVIKLNIADNMLKQFMELVDTLPKGSVVIEEINDETANDPYFLQRKTMIQQRLNDMDNGQLKTNNFDQFESEMDDFEKILEKKYDN